MSTSGNGTLNPDGPGQRFQILSLDGGGIRGLFSAAVLAAIEEDLGVDVTEHFDLIAGTSTGGIVAIALGLGIRPLAIVEFYRQHGPEIFGNVLGWRWLLHRVYRKYPSTALVDALKAVFQERRFGEIEKRLVIPAYDLGNDNVYLFRTPHTPHLRRDHRCAAWAVAQATSAAPTYFPACRAVDELRLVDGGLWANNPSMVALIEASGALSIPLTHVSMLSIGTCEAVSRRKGALDSGGLFRWAPNAPDILMRATSLAVTNQVRHLIGDRLLRLDPKVAEADVVLDKVNASAALVARARHHSRNEMPKIEPFMKHWAAEYVPHYGRRDQA